MHAVTPEPHVKAISFSINIFFDLKISIKSSFFLKVLSFFKSFWKGRFIDPLMFPLLSSFRGSGCKPKNLCSPLASSNWNLLLVIFLFTSSLFITRDVFSTAMYLDLSKLTISLVVGRFSFLHFLKPPSNTEISFGSWPKYKKEIFLQ